MGVGRQVQCGNADLLVAQGGKKQLTPQLQHQQAGGQQQQQHLAQHGGGTAPAEEEEEEAFRTQFTALNTSRSVRTRQLARAQENTQLARTARLAQVFRDISSSVLACKGEWLAGVGCLRTAEPGRLYHSSQ